LLLAASGGLWCRADAQTGTIQDVRHVVILMQENRSFDHYFGAHKGVRGFNDRNALVFPNGKTDFYQRNGAGYVLPFHITAQCLNDPDHGMFTGEQGANMGKWDNWVAWRGPEAMAHYTRNELPFYYALADAFTICDEYHCSVFGPTYPNRLYLMTGTIDPAGVAGGPVTDNGLYRPYSWTTYPERLQAAGVTWKVYQQASDYYNLNPLRWFRQYADTLPGDPLYDRGIALVDDLLGTLRADVSNGTLPQVSWIIPPWSLSEHPALSPANGQILTWQLLEILASNPALYSSTVFILTYDEDGGFFDHVVSPLPPPGTPDEFVSGLPIGLGVRVPAIIVSPWSRGGYVCSEVFDHTSVIRFLEQWTGVKEPNISAWRRQVCGDLTSAFDFTSPEFSYPLLLAPAPVGCLGGQTPEPPSVQVFPVQEAGTNRSRARPYRSNAFSITDCAGGRLGITMTNAGTVTEHFAIYANAFNTNGPWQYDIPAHHSVSSYFSVADNEGRYDFTCYGAHRFHQRFAGTVRTNCSHVDVRASPHPDGTSLILAMQNSTMEQVTFSVSSADATMGFTIPSGCLLTNTVPGAVKEDGSYTLSVVASTDPTFLRQFLGDAETAALQFLVVLPPDPGTNPPPPPTFPSVHLSGQNLILTFPTWAAGYILESANDVVSASWAVVTATPVTNGANAILTVPIVPDAESLYFRMRP
jgi:phospholipase C